MNHERTETSDKLLDEVIALISELRETEIELKATKGNVVIKVDISAYYTDEEDN